ncbi:hypothetical protein BDK61_4369 [Haloarcula quadrata]|uniref:Uncharacterized protein n=1 Tax=Haloarcula quadrata TaxID=182779 RepID=A0A495QQS7_9EURY|nr:hypothetical protein BDK61_4369 [Haloarcula quadrata]
MTNASLTKASLSHYAKRGGSPESVLVSWWESFTVRLMLLLPAEFIVQYLFDSMEKRVVEREICREYSPATSWSGEYCPLKYDPQPLLPERAERALSERHETVTFCMI